MVGRVGCLLLVVWLAGEVGVGLSSTREEFDAAWKSAEHSYEGAISQYVRDVLGYFTGLSIPTIRINASSKFDQDITVNATVEEASPFIEAIHDTAGTTAAWLGDVTSFMSEGFPLSTVFASATVYGSAAINYDITRFWVAVGEDYILQWAASHISRGSGVGFGAQLLCDDRVIVSLGGGIGGGSDGTIDGGLSYTYGWGGGGGVQGYSADGTLFLSIGGGGGATTGGGETHGSDAGQIPTGFSESAYLVQQQVEACRRNGSTVSISGGGGGGGGIRAALSFEGGIAAIYYGVGWGFNIPATIVHGESSAPPSKAALLRGSHSLAREAPPSSLGPKMGEIAQTCRANCLSSSGVGGGGHFWQCYCPCTKKGYLELKLAWAQHMGCQSLQGSSAQVEVH